MRVRGGSAADWSARLEGVVGRAGDAVVVARRGAELLGHGVLVRREAHQDGSPAGSYLRGVTVAPFTGGVGVLLRARRPSSGPG